jgi:hypothetical protein
VGVRVVRYAFIRTKVPLPPKSRAWRACGIAGRGTCRRLGHLRSTVFSRAIETPFVARDLEIILTQIVGCRRTRVLPRQWLPSTCQTPLVSGGVKIILTEIGAPRDPPFRDRA